MGDKLDEKDKRKAEVRARLAAETAAAKKKKGFMTPARKKKLSALIRALAAEERKKEQLRKAEERRRILAERTGEPLDFANANEAELIQMMKQYQEKMNLLEAQKYDLEYGTSKKDYQIVDLRQKVTHRPGKFTKPALKKVSQAKQQMEKIALFTAKISASNYRDGLKIVSVKEKVNVQDK